MAIKSNKVKIKVEGLKKSFGHLKVLNGIDLEVHEGEVVCVIGPSGGGKSTFLRCLNRLEDITAGKVMIDGYEITDKKVNINKVRQNIGMVFQQFNLFPHKTVLQNIMLAPVDLKLMSKTEAEKKAFELLKRVGLEEKADCYPHQLSGGQQQRVAIARAVVGKPSIILADEPTGNLDSKNGMEVMQLLSELNEEGTTIVMVTHSQHDAMMANRIINLFDGQVVDNNNIL